MDPEQKISAYRAFLEAKRPVSPDTGFEVDPREVHPLLKPHQRDVVCWAVRGGRRALFEAFGLGKSVQQLEIVRLVLAKLGGGRGLIVAPLGVRQEFRRDAAMLGQEITFVRASAEVQGPGLYLTNYESVREGKLEVDLFQAVSLDEASCLRGFGGTKTFREFMRLFEGRGPKYKFVATATPSPNEYIELLAYAAFLEVMDVGQAKTRFFKRDSTKADKLTLHPHKEEEFWHWVASWAVFLQRPSDLGYSDEGYDLPPIEVRWHEIPSDHSGAGAERDGQGRMFADAAVGVVDAAREKRSSLDARIAKLLEIRAEDPDAHRIIWHDLEDERRAIEAACPEAVSVYGAQDLEVREAAIVGFSEGRIQELAAKPVLAGSGCNFQRHCAWAVYLGIGFKFNDFIQSLHRLQRFLQTERVRVDLIYTEAERGVREILERKWRQHEELVSRMSEIIREHKLTSGVLTGRLTRAMGVERREVRGSRYHLVHGDAVEEVARMETGSVDFTMTSVPFATQYEYSPNFADFGHTDDDAHFWRQMDFLTPELLRVMSPGRVCAVHVKDRIVPGGINGFGFQTSSTFSDDCTRHFLSHGWAYLGRITVVTDVVRENNQTYRLGWSEQCKDGSKMGVGMPEYVLLFRAPQTDRTKGYADIPVRKRKKIWQEDHWDNPDGYSRGRWQIDAHGFWRSSGDRYLTPDDLVGRPAETVFKLFKRWGLTAVYDYEIHVGCAERLEEAGSLPPDFMLLQPPSWHPTVWTDVARMRTLNGAQAQKGREMHLCPLQFDIVDRLIGRYSMPGDLVFDPFGGLMTVPVRALMLGRRGAAVELNPVYFEDGLRYVEAAEIEASTPTLFDLLKVEHDQEDAA